MDRSREIRELLKDISGGSGVPFVIGEVVSVESETCTVKVAGRVTVGDVRLNASADGNGGNILVKPAMGSMVLMADLSGGDLRELVVTAWSEIDTVTVKFKGDVVINGGENEGLVCINELKENLESIKTYVETMNAAISTGLAGIGVGESASGSNGKAEYEGAMSGAAISFKDMEDKKIKH